MPVVYSPEMVSTPRTATLSWAKEYPMVIAVAPSGTGPVASVVDTAASITAISTIVAMVARRVQ